MLDKSARRIAQIRTKHSFLCFVCFPQLSHSVTEQTPTLTPSPEHFIQKRDVSREILSELDTLTCSQAQCLRLNCVVGLLGKDASVLLKVRFRLWAETFIKRKFRPYVLECQASYDVLQMPYEILPSSLPSGMIQRSTSVVWTKQNTTHSVPLWIIVLAVLAGLLLLALLIYVLYKVSLCVWVGQPH
ncbi:integrin alpha-5-like [Polypterus senegalus]|uniref:integrin alpha-5-like n=1 Tax=Polypterus senegalus TaxID=55291 RepID=UPI001962F0C3|nr:integrin alpha-5-like [Polypterus senegalus]